mgnify:CR=1 FL=1
MEPLVASLLVLAAAAVFSPLGLGAGIVYVPILHYGLGLDFGTEAVPLSLCLVWISFVSSRIFSQSDDGAKGDIHLTAILAASIGALVGGLAAHQAIEQFGDVVATVLKISALFLTIWYLKSTVGFMLNEVTHRPWLEDDAENLRDNFPSELRLWRWMGQNGAVAALLGVGSGVVNKPVLRHIGLSNDSASSTSDAIVMVIVPVAFTAHMLTRDVSSSLVSSLIALSGLFPSIAIVSFLSVRWSLHHRLPMVIYTISIVALLMVLVNYSCDLMTHALGTPSLVDALSFTQLVVAVLVVGPVLIHQAWCNMAIKRGLPELPEGDLPSLTVVIPTWNEALIIEGKLNNLSKQSYPRDRLDVIIIDSASEDETVAKSRAWFDANPDAFGPSVRIIEESERRGKSFSINHAFSESSGEVVMMSDVDCRLDEGALERLARWFIDPEIGAVTGHQNLIDESGSTEIEQEVAYRHAFTRFRHGESCLDSTPIFHGECSAYRASAIEGRPLIEGANADDSQMAVYVRRQGLRTIWDEHLIFREVAPPDSHAQRVQKVRRAQGLTRHFARNSDLWFTRKQGAFGRIIGMEGWMHVITPWLVVGGFLLGLTAIAAFIFDGGAGGTWMTYLMLFIDGAVLLFLISARIRLPIPLARTSSAFGSYMWILFKAHVMLIRKTSLHRWEQVTAVRERLAQIDSIQR